LNGGFLLNQLGEPEPAHLHTDRELKASNSFQGLSSILWKTSNSVVASLKTSIASALVHLIAVIVFFGHRFLLSFNKGGSKCPDDKGHEQMSKMTNWVELAAAARRIIMNCEFWVNQGQNTVELLILLYFRCPGQAGAF
jgi:hypothetical protein